MTNYPEQLFSALRGLVLSERERANIRLAVLAHMREHPIQAPMHVRALSVVSQLSTTLFGRFSSKSFIAHPAFAALALVLCVGVGTSYAASSALPGEPLYSFKTRVNEQVEGVLAVTPQAKAEWSASLAERRLEEAEVLAVAGKLSPVASAAIESGVEYAIASFDTSIKRLADKDDSSRIADAQSDLEASLNAHETVLASLGSDAKSDVSPLVALVHQHAEKMTSSRFETEVSIASKDDSSVRKAALGKQKSAKKQLKQATALSTAIATSTADVSALTSISKEAQNDIDAGESEVKNGKWGKAYGAFQSANRKLKETKTSVDARERLRAQLKQQIATETAAATATIATTTVASSTPESTNLDTKEDTNDKSGSSDESDKDSKDEKTDSKDENDTEKDQ